MAEPEDLGGISVDLVINADTLDFSAAEQKINAWLAKFNPVVSLGIEAPGGASAQPAQSGRGRGRTQVAQPTSANAAANITVEQKALQAAVDKAGAVTLTIKEFKIAEGAIDKLRTQIEQALGNITIGVAAGAAAGPQPTNMPGVTVEKVANPVIPTTAEATTAPREKYTGKAKEFAGIWVPLRTGITDAIQKGNTEGLKVLSTRVENAFQQAAQVNLSALGKSQQRQFKDLFAQIAQVRDTSGITGGPRTGVIGTALDRAAAGQPMGAAPAMAATTVTTLAAAAMGVTSGEVKSVGRAVRAGARRGIARQQAPAYVESPTRLQPDSELGYGALVEGRTVIAEPELGRDERRRDRRQSRAKMLRAGRAHRRQLELEGKAEKFEATYGGFAGGLTESTSRARQFRGEAEPTARELTAEMMAVQGQERVAGEPGANILPGQTPPGGPRRPMPANRWRGRGGPITEAGRETLRRDLILPTGLVVGRAGEDISTGDIKSEPIRRLLERYRQGGFGVSGKYGTQLVRAGRQTRQATEAEVAMRRELGGAPEFKLEGQKVRFLSPNDLFEQALGRITKQRRGVTPDVLFQEDTTQFARDVALARRLRNAGFQRLRRGIFGGGHMRPVFQGTQGPGLLPSERYRGPRPVEGLFSEPEGRWVTAPTAFEGPGYYGEYPTSEELTSRRANLLNPQLYPQFEGWEQKVAALGEEISTMPSEDAYRRIADFRREMQLANRRRPLPSELLTDLGGLASGVSIRGGRRVEVGVGRSRRMRTMAAPPPERPGPSGPRAIARDLRSPEEVLWTGRAASFRAASREIGGRVAIASQAGEAPSFAGLTEGTFSLLGEERVRGLTGERIPRTKAALDRAARMAAARSQAARERRHEYAASRGITTNDRILLQRGESGIAITSETGERTGPPRGRYLEGTLEDVQDVRAGQAGEAMVQPRTTRVSLPRPREASTTPQTDLANTIAARLQAAVGQGPEPVSAEPPATPYRRGPDGPTGGQPPTAQEPGGAIHVIIDSPIPLPVEMAGGVSLAAAEGQAPVRRGKAANMFAAVEGAEAEEGQRGRAEAKSATVGERQNIAQRLKASGMGPRAIADFLGGARRGWSVAAVRALLGETEEAAGGAGGGAGGGGVGAAPPAGAPAYGTGFPRIRMLPRVAGTPAPAERIPILPAEPLGLQRQRMREVARSEREAEQEGRTVGTRLYRDPKRQREAARQEAAAFGVKLNLPEREPYEMSDEAIYARAAAAAARRSSPIRALSTAFGSIFAAGGAQRFEERLGFFQRARVQQGFAERQLGDVQKAQQVFGETTAGLRAGRAAGAPIENIRAVRRGALETLGLETGAGYRATAELIRQARTGGGTEAQKRAEDELAAATEERAKREKALSPPAEVAQNLLKLGVGAAVGARAFQVLSKSMDLAINEIAKAAAPLVDQLNGFRSTATRVTSALGDQTKALHGNVEGAIAVTSADAGLSDTINKLVTATLAPAAVAKGGARTEASTVDLLRATFATQRGQAPEGLFGGYGGVLGTPFLAGTVGGGKGFTEQLAGLVGGVTAQGAKPTVSGDRGVVAIRGAAAGSAAAATAEGSAQANLSVIAKNYSDALSRGAAYLGDQNAQFEFIITADKKMQQGMEDAGTAAGDTANAASLAARGFVLVDKSTKQVVTSGEAYSKAMLQAAQGLQLADPKVYLAQLKQQLAGQLQSITVQSQFQRQVALPTQAALTGLAQPQIAPEAGLFPGRGAVGVAATGGLTKSTQDAINQSLARTKGYQQDIVDYQNQGIKAARQLVIDTGGDVKAFNNATIAAQQFQSTIGSLEEKIGFKQAAYDTAQWNNQIRLANRALSDARGLAGQVSGPGNLGAIQRQQFMVGRQSQALGLQLQQRQITTQLALAQFQAPGETGEERAARQREKIIEARIAQRQLGYERTQFGLAGQAFNVEAQRGVTDTTWARDLAIQGRNTEKTIGALSKELTAAQQAQQKYLNGVTTSYGEATGKFEAALSVATGYVSTFGKTAGTVSEVLKTVLEEMGVTFTPVAKNTDRGGARPSARGIVGMASGPTTALFGEAGTEAVAILRNPRQGTWGGAGGGSVSVTFTGPITVSSEADIAAIVRAVEAAISRKGQMLGLRGPAY